MISWRRRQECRRVERVRQHMDPNIGQLRSLGVNDMAASSSNAASSGSWTLGPMARVPGFVEAHLPGFCHSSLLANGDGRFDIVGKVIWGAPGPIGSDRFQKTGSIIPKDGPRSSFWSQYRPKNIRDMPWANLPQKREHFFLATMSAAGRAGHFYFPGWMITNGWMMDDGWLMFEDG